jgi:hypothetical protein
MRRRERRGARAARAVAAYAEWRVASAAVANAYRRWVGARAAERRHAFADYNVALNREEHAASRFADLVRPASAATDRAWIGRLHSHMSGGIPVTHARGLS